MYISHQDFQRIVDVCPARYQPILWTAYYTGMRRGEILSLTRRQVNLGTRIVRLGERDTKEGKAKRVPIHRDLVPVLDECAKVAHLGIDRVFLIQDKDGIHPPSDDSTQNPWRRQIPKLGFDPAPRFHDLRHTWRTNARRSGMHPEIEMAIMGHSQRGKSVYERYGRISDQELLDAIDKLCFSHGETEIWASR